PLRNQVKARGFIGGWAGLLSFELRCFIEELAPPKPIGPQFPDLQAGFYPWTICYDHATGDCELRLLNGAPGGPEDIHSLARDLTELLERDTEQLPHDLADPELLTDRDTWVAGVKEV